MWHQLHVASTPSTGAKKTQDETKDEVLNYDDNDPSVKKMLDDDYILFPASPNVRYSLTINARDYKALDKRQRKAQNSADLHVFRHSFTPKQWSRYMSWLKEESALLKEEAQRRYLSSEAVRKHYEKHPDKPFPKQRRLRKQLAYQEAVRKHYEKHPDKPFPHEAARKHYEKHPDKPFPLYE